MCVNDEVPHPSPGLKARRAPLRPTAVVGGEGTRGRGERRSVARDNSKTRRKDEMLPRMTGGAMTKHPPRVFLPAHVQLITYALLPHRPR